MEEYSKSELESKKVAELKELAASFNLEVKGLRKAEIISDILEYQNSNYESSVAISSEPADEKVSDKFELSEEVSNEYPKRISLKRPAILYDSIEKTKILGKVKNSVIAIDEIENFYKIKTFVFGKGNIEAFILK